MAGLRVFDTVVWRQCVLRRIPSCLSAICLGFCFLLSSPVDARAGWFQRDNQVAYRLYRSGQESEALTYWDKSAEGWFGRGAALMRLGRMRDAEQAFRQSLELMPEIRTADAEGGPARNSAFMASIWYNIGNCLYAGGQLLPAAEAWRSALNYEPEHAKARHNLAVVNRLLGKEAEPDETLSGLGKQARGDGGGGTQSAAAQGRKAGKKEKRQASTAQAKGGGKQPSPQAEHRKGGNGQDGNGAKRQGGQVSQSASVNGSGHRNDKAGKGGQPHAKDIGSRQAEHELRLVKEGVSVFLRHRLNEKEKAASAYRGPAW